MVFGMVLLAALASTTANYLSLRTYVDWKSENSNCAEGTQLAKLGLNRAAESALKEMARGVQAEVKNNYLFDVSVGAEGRTLSYTYRFKRPWPDSGAFYQWMTRYQKTVLDGHCSDDEDFVLKIMKATETHTFYSPGGERLTSFSIDQADCPRR
jgi:hypothetical protein